MTDREIILLFKENSGMDERRWKKFCIRYATRDLFAVLEYVCNASKARSKTLEHNLRREMLCIVGE